MNRELMLFAKAIWYGVVLLMGYDVFRIWRRVIRHGVFAVVAEDLLYWISSSLFLFSRIYQGNSGIIRGYFFVGVVLGAIFYHYSISALLVQFLSDCLNRVKKVFMKVWKIVLKFTKRLKFRLNRCKIRLYKQFCKFLPKGEKNHKGNQEDKGKHEKKKKGIRKIKSKAKSKV